MDINIRPEEFRRCYSMLKKLRTEFGGESSINLVSFYFEVIASELSKEKLEQQEAGRRLELSGAAASRNTTLLLHMRGRNRPGLNLVEPYVDWDDRRRRYLQLTDHGKQFINKLLKG